MATQKEAWHKFTKEDTLDPELQICDPHHHLWDYPNSFVEDRVLTSAWPVRPWLSILPVSCSGLSI